MKPLSIRAVVGAGVLLAGAAACYGWLSWGIFSDREFSSHYLFSKHRLSPRFFFYAPTGESDTPLASLTPDEQQAETAYQEFVERNGGYSRKYLLWK
jgi:hypothetical protein